MKRVSRSALNWRDFLLTPLVEVGLLLAAGAGTFVARGRWSMSVFLSVVVFVFLLFVFTLIALRIVRFGLRVKRGIVSYQTNPWLFYFWNLHTFLCSTNLVMPYMSGLLPPVFRPFFYKLLGAQINSSGVRIRGRILDPYLVRIERSVSIDDDVLIMPHGYAVGSPDMLILDQVVLKEGAYVGARSTLMPGVEVGENAMVKSMSIVSMNTKIPSGEVWGGNPATKIADVDKPLQEAA